MREAVYRIVEDKAIRMEPSWSELIGEIRRSPSLRSIFILGAVDTGKTALASILSSILSGSCRVALVDCDPGQSTIGPPTTVGFAWAPIEGHDVVAMRFIGSTTPAGYLLETAVAVRIVADEAFRLGGERVVFDSCGFGDKGPGKDFFIELIDLVAPDMLVAIERDDELSPLISHFASRTSPSVRTLPVHPEARRRGREERRRYRRERLADYFSRAVDMELDLSRMDLTGRVPEASEAPGRLVGLEGEGGLTCALGIARRLELGLSRLLVTCPETDPARIHSLRFGSVSFDPESLEERQV